MTLIPTILCGGAGTRLWPISRTQHPKPFIKLQDGESLLQKAFMRGASLKGVESMLTVTNKDFFFKTEEEYKDLKITVDNHFILEPFGKNTAAAIASTCLYIKKYFGEDAIALVLPADHLISKFDAFEEAVTKAYALAGEGKIVTFGIEPHQPETGYGYIEYNGHDVVRFVEKPTFEKAQEYIATGNFVWNSGMFCFKASTMYEEMKKTCPHILQETEIAFNHAKLEEKKNQKILSFNHDDYEKIESDSIDYAVMEKTKKAAVVPCTIGWSDIGCWNSLGNLNSKDDHGNRLQGNVFTQNTKNCTIIGEDRVIGTVGLENLVIVDTKDALLIADKTQSQDVKTIFSKLKDKDHDAHKWHQTVYRPWGSYTIIGEGPGYKIKRIEVKPGSKLSLQMHHHRSEHWIVVKGVAHVVNGDKDIELKENESTFIPATHKHRLENKGSETLAIVEVQTGSYLGEDDIVRFEDIYGRVS